MAPDRSHACRTRLIRLGHLTSPLLRLLLLLALPLLFLLQLLLLLPPESVSFLLQRVNSLLLLLLERVPIHAGDGGGGGFACCLSRLVVSRICPKGYKVCHRPRLTHRRLVDRERLIVSLSLFVPRGCRGNTALLANYLAHGSGAAHSEARALPDHRHARRIRQRHASAHGLDVMKSGPAAGGQARQADGLASHKAGEPAATQGGHGGLNAQANIFA